jgi:hypothetical protein
MTQSNNTKDPHPDEQQTTCTCAGQDQFSECSVRNKERKDKSERDNPDGDDDNAPSEMKSRFIRKGEFRWFVHFEVVFQCSV